MQEGKKQRIEFLDYLKAVCVIMVIITHYGWEDKTSPFFTMLINMAVPVFMIVSGYNFAMSNRKKADGNLEKMYGWNMMKPKLIRFLLPFFAICLLEILLLAAQDKNIPLFRIFVLGAYGPGSYYVPIMLQLLVIFPLIYVMIAYNAKLGLAVAALANLAFEVCVIVFDMDKYYYRLSIGRYLLLIAFGCYLYLHPEQRVKPYQMWMMFLAGLAYLIAVFGFDKDFELFGYWKTTAMPVAFYIFPIVILLFRKFYHCTIPGFAGRLLTQIGKASYHIFLIQMVYYHFELGGAIMQTAWYIAVPFNILVTVPLGLGFYELDNQGTHNEKVLLREVGRLETSLKAAGDREKLCFLHYPPLYLHYTCPEILHVLSEYGVHECCYGHIHGYGCRSAFIGESDGVRYRLVSADFLDFVPYKLR